MLLRGSAWVTAQGGDPVQLSPGDVAVLSGGAPYMIADDPATNQADGGDSLRGLHDSGQRNNGTHGSRRGQTRTVTWELPRRSPNLLTSGGHPALGGAALRAAYKAARPCR